MDDVVMLMSNAEPTVMTESELPVEVMMATGPAMVAEAMVGSASVVELVTAVAGGGATLVTSSAVAWGSATACALQRGHVGARFATAHLPISQESMQLA